MEPHFTRKRYPRLPETLHALLAEGQIERIGVEDDKAEWTIHAEDVPLLDRVERNDFAFERTTLLSPFDNLICDRARTAKLFNFDFRIEIYTPQHKRQYGYYVLPILHGDRLIGRIDPKMDREHNRLHIHAVHAEKDAPLNRGPPARSATAIEELAIFLGATDIHYTHLVPSGLAASFALAPINLITKRSEPGATLVLIINGIFDCPLDHSAAATAITECTPAAVTTSSRLIRARSEALNERSAIVQPQAWKRCRATARQLVSDRRQTACATGCRGELIGSIQHGQEVAAGRHQARPSMQDARARAERQPAESASAVGIASVADR